MSAEDDIANAFGCLVSAALGMAVVCIAAIVLALYSLWQMAS